MTWIKLDVPVGPSANHMYTNAKRWTIDKNTGQRKTYTGRRLTAKAEAYKQEVGWMLLNQSTPQEREGLPARPIISVVIHEDTPLDLDNLQKLLLDGIFDALNRNDRTIYSLMVTRSEDAAPGRVSVQIGGS